MGITGRSSCRGGSWMMTIWSRRTSNWSWGSRIKISHQIGIAARSARSARTGQGLLQLFFLLAIFGSSILKPYLKQKYKYMVFHNRRALGYILGNPRDTILLPKFCKNYTFPNTWGKSANSVHFYMYLQFLFLKRFVNRVVMKLD